MIAIIIIIILYSLGIITICILFGIVYNQNTIISHETSDTNHLSTDYIASQELIDYVTTSSEEIPSSEILVVTDEIKDTNTVLQYNTTDLETVYHSNQINPYSKEIICDFKNKDFILDYIPSNRCYI